MINNVAFTAAGAPAVVHGIDASNGQKLWNSGRPIASAVNGAVSRGGGQIYVSATRRHSLRFRFFHGALKKSQLFAGAAVAQSPDGPGKEENTKICSQCHELARSFSLRQDRDGRAATINKMVGLGAQGSDKDFALVLNYLSTNFPGEAIPKLNVNNATAIELRAPFRSGVPNPRR